MADVADARTMAEATNAAVAAGTSGGFSRPETITPRLIGSIIATGLLTFIGILTETVMNVLFPELMAEFHVGTSTVQWLTTGYLLMVALTVPLSSYLKRKCTLRSQFVAASVLCIAGAAVALLAVNFPMLLGARLLQGIGTGVAMPLMINIIVEQSPRARVGVLMGVGNVLIGTAPALGPTFGGFVSTFLSWRYVFVIVLPLLALSLIVGLLSIRQSAPLEDAHLNPLHMLCVVVGFVSLIIALDRGGAAVTALASGSGGSDGADGSGAAGSLALAIVLVVVGVAALVAFALMSRRSFSPMIRLGVLRSVSFRWHLLAYMLFQGTTISFGYLLPNLAQLGFGSTVMAAGLVILPGALIGALLAPVGGAMLDRFGPARPICVATAVALLGVALMAMLVDGSSSLPQLAVFYVVYMLGFPMAFSNIMTSGLSDLPDELTADGNALFSTFQQLAGAAGTTTMSVILAIAQSGSGVGEIGSAGYRAATVEGAHHAFLVLLAVVVIVACSLVRAFLYRRGHRLVRR
ncbi:multidrug MFS transporter [Bifidobacterium eulemuris]|uniref:Multidrug MFS transporter n=2 Tax=Bifidobacterium eulemuris TaxID=1765219 RepID=A0A261G3H6_9BIFI|nr:multidrug MFS transporter [Bifidobacterium eulemuris]